MALDVLITWFDSRWFPSFEVLTPRTARRSESLAQHSALTARTQLQQRGLSALTARRLSFSSERLSFSSEGKLSFNSEKTQL
jgi:hypothetical protein